MGLEPLPPGSVSQVKRYHTTPMDDRNLIRTSIASSLFVTREPGWKAGTELKFLSLRRSKNSKQGKLHS